ncbi:hypothetical protein ENTCAN_05499 [Enterobacter cancerogenus ATCC 35316]|nr:hypothetical protein ENTCAN_05499 [Enterobacter cancerogenus ATCC 35316]
MITEVKSAIRLTVDLQNANRLRRKACSFSKVAIFCFQAKKNRAEALFIKHITLWRTD